MWRNMFTARSIASALVDDRLGPRHAETFSASLGDVSRVAALRPIDDGPASASRSGGDATRMTPFTRSVGGPELELAQQCSQRYVISMLAKAAPMQRRMPPP
jgi:hypothetical protein